MAGSSAYTEEQKTGFVDLARKKGRAAAAKKAGVSTVTVSSWARALGVDLRLGKAAAAKPPSGVTMIPDWTETTPATNGARNGHTVNGHTNGHAPPPPVPALSAQGLDAVKHQLETALAGVNAMREAFRQVFGG